MSSKATPTVETQLSPAPLWPAPMFVLGVGALLAVWFCRPMFPDTSLRVADRLLHSAWTSYRTDAELDKVVKPARRAAELSATRSDEAALILGLAHVRKAERTDPAVADPHWREAQQFLVQAEKANLNDATHKSQLALALAKCGYFSNEDPKAIIARLTPLADGDDRAEVLKLLTGACLRLNPPDVQKAWEYNKQLRLVPDLSNTQLAMAQLIGGELELRLKNPAEACKTLDVMLKNNPTIPANALLSARLMLAMGYQEQMLWDRAVKEYNDAIMSAKGTPLPNEAQVYYNVGLCYMKLNNAAEAQKRWERCRQVANGEEKQAALIVSAEILLVDNAPESVTKAIDLLKSATETVTAAAGWNNKLVNLERAQEIFEKVIGQLANTGRQELALQALESYTRIAQPVQKLSWTAKLCADVAKKLETDKSAKPDESQNLYRRAAAAYSQVAALPGLEPAVVVANLRFAVRCHLAGGERSVAVAKLEQLSGMEMKEAEKSEVCYLLGEEYRATGRNDKAEKAYEECIQYSAKYAYMARYQIALLLASRGEIEAARKTLEDNLSSLQFERDPEAKAYTVIKLCDLLYRQKAYENVVSRCARLLGEVPETFKDREELGRARYQLADSYRLQASYLHQKYLLSENSTRNTQEPLKQQYQELLVKAAEAFTQLDRDLEKPEWKGTLSPELLTQIPTAAAKCWSSANKWEEALEFYNKLIERTKGKPEWLEAMGGAVSCHAGKYEKNNILQRLLEMERALPSYSTEIREPWKRWIEDVRKGLAGIDDPQ